MTENQPGGVGREDMKAVGHRLCSEPKVLLRIKQKVDKNQARIVKGKLSEGRWQGNTDTKVRSLCSSRATFSDPMSLVLVKGVEGREGRPHKQTQLH